MFADRPDAGCQALETTPCPIEEFASRVGEQLERTFGFRFDLWRLRGDWFPISPTAAPLAGVDDDQWAQLLEHFAGDCLRPTVEPCGNSYALAIPLRSGDGPLVAVAECTRPESTLLLRLAEAFLRESRLREELDCCTAVAETSSAELSQAFEELVLLRQLAENIELSELSPTPFALVRKALPLLEDTLHAESVFYIGVKSTAQPKESPAATDFEVIRSSKSRTWPPELWKEIIERYGEKCRSRPAVWNRHGVGPAETALPGVDSLVVAAVPGSHRVVGWLVAINRDRRFLMTHGDWDRANLTEFGTPEASLLRTVASVLAANGRNVELLQQKDDVFVGAVRALISAVDAKDRYTSGHSERVGLFARRIGDELDFDETFCARLYLGGLLHDIGKIAIPGEVLRKPGQLTAEEFEHIRQHPDRGWEILNQLERLKNVLPGIVHHHERLDGNGYPDGLRGEDIPLAARILAVADTYDALTSDRPYRSGLPQEKAEEILHAGAGTQWDPDVIRTAIHVMPDLIAIRLAHSPSEPKRRRSGRTVADADHSQKK